ncbi:protease complex subunit PrcB family protein [Lentibacillus lipolyticus]|nr:protease complex subunit PrcB family protein [Lentibacillus lipolyticus]
MRTCMLVVLSALVLTGCGSVESGDKIMTEEGPIVKEKTDLSFKTIDVLGAPGRVRSWIEKNRSDEAKKVFRVNGKTYAVIMLGQKPTGGFDVEIEQIQLVKIVQPESKAGEGTIHVSYQTIEPEEGSFNIQALTYPMAIAELEGEWNQPFQFRTRVEPEKRKADD